MLNLYPQLIQYPIRNSPLSAAECKGKYLTLTERHIQALWWEQIYFKELITSCGKKITVLSQGQWNGSSGPDFLKAHLLIDGVDYKGDIEIHLADSGWETHGHHTNPYYNNTILHLSYWKNASSKIIRTENGKAIPCLYIEDQLNISPQKILTLIDIDLYPYKPSLGTGKCASALFNTLTEDEVRQFLTGASLYRIAQKGTQVASLASTEEKSLTAGLARCLGFPMNSNIFLQLYLTLSNLPQRYSTEEYQAFCLGACGFFNETSQEKWLNSEKFRELFAYWEERPPAAIPSFKLFPQRTRPLHHPLRRLITLGFLLGDESLRELPNKIKYTWQNRSEHCRTSRNWKALWNDLKMLLPNYYSEYWNSHYFFELVSSQSDKSLVLLGDQIKSEMMSNVILPFINNSFNLIDHQQNNFIHFYQKLLCEQTYKSNYLKNRFFGDTLEGNIFKHTFASQGALQIHFDFCQHYETSCIGCPFIERFIHKRFINNVVANK